MNDLANYATGGAMANSPLPPGIGKPMVLNSLSLAEY